MMWPLIFIRTTNKTSTTNTHTHTHHSVQMLKSAIFDCYWAHPRGHLRVDGYHCSLQFFHFYHLISTKLTILNLNQLFDCIKYTQSLTIL